MESNSEKPFMRSLYLFVLILLAVTSAQPLFASELPYKKPQIKLSYGLPKISLHNAPNFTPNQIFEVDLGMKRMEFSYIEAKGFIVDYAEPFIFGSFIPEKTQNSAEVSLWRFGFGSKDGYGYNFRNSSLVLQVIGNYSWSDWDISNSGKFIRYERFSNGLKFGKSIGAGIEYQLNSWLNFGATYEQSHIFAAYVFPESVTASLLQFAAHKLSNQLIHPLCTKAPSLLPVLHFVVHNALNFGLYELRAENSFWPLKSEPPVAIQSIKFHISVIF